jgi:quercetin dioxygenase-like cupin family protein
MTSACSVGWTWISERMTKRNRVRLFLAAAPLIYVVAGAFLSGTVFREQAPDLSDQPRRGLRIENPAIKSAFVYRQTSAETNGATFEVDVFIEPGGGPGNLGGDHIHPYAEERFRVVEGTIRVLLDGVARDVSAGHELVVTPGVAHSYLNVSSEPAHVVGVFKPAAEMDSYFVQVDRAGGLGQTSMAQMIAFLTRYDHTYAAGMPKWVQRGLAFVIFPTARLFGVKSYYPPPKE